MIITEQIRAARALLGWNQTELAIASGVGIATVRRIEIRSGVPSGNHQTIANLVTSLEKAGIEFIDADGNKGPGVRLATNASKGHGRTGPAG